MKALDYYQSEWISKSFVPYVATDVSDVSQVETFIHDLISSKGVEEKLEDGDEEEEEQANHDGEGKDVGKSLKEKEERKVSVR